MAKQNVIKMISPPAAAAYAWLSKPDEGQEYSDGKYKVTLKLDKNNKEHKGFIKEIDANTKEMIEELQQNDKTWKSKDLSEMKPAYRDGDDSTKEDFHGFFTLTCKTKFRPGMVDCSDPVQSLPEGDEPRSGDLIRASIAIQPYMMGKSNFGVSAQLRNVQLVDRNNLGQESDEFGAVDGGYTSSSKPVVQDDDEDF